MDQNPNQNKFLKVALRNWGFPGGTSGKEPACQGRRHKRPTGVISGSGKSPGEGNDYPLRYSHLENFVDRGTWWAMVHGAAKVGHDLVTKSPPPYD